MQLVHSSISNTAVAPVKKDTAQSIRVTKWMNVQYQKQYDEVAAKYGGRIGAIRKEDPNFKIEII